MTPGLAVRLRTTLAALGFVQLLVIGLALYAFDQMRSDQERITGQLYSTIQDSNDTFVRVIELNEAAQAYYDDGDPEDLARLRELQQPGPGAVGADELERRLRPYPEATRALQEVRTVATEWLRRQEALVAAVQAQGPQAVTPVEARSQGSLFAQVRAGYDAYIDAVRAARNDVVEQLDRRTSLLFGTVVAAVLTSVVAGLALYAALRGWVLRPLAELGQEARTVRGGALHHAVDVDGPPEIRALAADVDAMRRGLVEQLAEVERTQAMLEQQAEDLRRSNRDLEQFAYVASHDLQEPLRKVSSFCQMLERRYKGQLDERADQYIEFAVDGAKRMQALINDLLTFSRVGRLGDGSAEVAMDEVLADALRNLALRIEENDAVVTSDPLPVLTGERRLLVQLLQNLVGNALKFHGDEPPRVHVGARRDDECWELSVSDNGIGVEPQYAERIFVIFQRLHPKADYDGTGIGLALCKKIVEHHGGTIWLDTEVERGTTFRFTLPVEAPERLALDPGSDTDSETDSAPAGARTQEAAWTTT